MLPVVEEFYTLQGEGFYTGHPAYFIRLGGCDIGCSWCDTKNSWNAYQHNLVDADRLIQNAVECPSSLVVITGGEPLMHNLDYLTVEMENAGLYLALETSGTYSLTGAWDWICLSPKKHRPPLGEIYSQANELKVVISEKEDLDWAFENAVLVPPSCKLYLQPEWSVFRSLTPVIVNFIKQNPDWKLSLQTHKFLRIP
jgi:7-carboxy-7-deazaguanine synthase